MKIQIVLLALLVLSVSACQIDSGPTQAVPRESTSIDPSFAVDVKLPFENSFPHRWNPSNDGTPFEPCVAFSDEELLRFDIDPTKVEDAAQVDGQGIRGCGWIMPDKFSLSSIVTNARSLGEYKSGKLELEWKPDFVVGQRLVGLADLNGDESSCSTYVQSYKSIVATTVMVSSAAEAIAEFDPCQIVTDFTEAYIGKIPG